MSNRAPAGDIIGAMRAAVLAVGSELLSTDRLDTNSLRLAALFEAHDAELIGKAVVGDEEAAIAAEIGRRLGQCDLLVVTGGLGPTADDVTREGCAAAVGRPLVDDPQIWAAIERRFAAFGRRPSPNNRRQAQVIAGARVLPNERGSAPGLRLEAAGTTIFLFPGVPHELERMLERDLAPWLAERSGGHGRERRTLRMAMRPESEVDQALEPAYFEFERRWITVLASPGEVRVRLTAAGPPAARGARLAAMVERVRQLLGETVYGEGEEGGLEQVVGDLLAARGRTVATAESCTGGLLAERLTRVPGSSRYFPGAVVAYANAEKVALLGVPAELLELHGAVSEEVARAMAEGARRHFAVDYALAVTGIAGPQGGSPEKPVGTVHLALAAADETRHRAVRLIGDRERIRWQASQAALEMLRRRILAEPGEEGGA